MPADPPVTSGASGDAAARAGSSGRARYRRILRFAAGVIVQTWWFELLLPRLGLERISARRRQHRLARAARRFHALAVQLGGLMIKVGQFLSARLDVLPPEVTDELAGLQDEVPPAPFHQVRAVAEDALGMPLERAYAWFDDEPVAAASLGQVYRARLVADDAVDTGFGQVVVKVQRPGIDEIVAIDLAALRRIAGWLARVRLVSDRVDAPMLVEEFATVSLQEIDYLHEAASAERFALDVADDARVGAPQIAWERTTRRVLTLSDVTAIKITDVDGLREAGIDPTEVAHTFAAVMFDQLFVRGFFHADPHPGNIFVTPGADGTWALTFVDFGMMGQITDQLRQGLRRVLIAVAARDGHGLVEAISSIGMLLPSADTCELERALTQLFARFGGMGFAELRDVEPREIRAFADEFGEVIRSLPFQLPENFLLVIRAMSLVSGTCSALDPRFNMWSAVEPYAARMMGEQSGGVARDLLGQVASSVGLAARLPRRLDEIITRAEEGRLTVATPDLDRRLARFERLARRVLGAVLFGSLLVGGILLRWTDPVFGGVLMALSAVPLLYALLADTLRRR